MVAVAVLHRAVPNPTEAVLLVDPVMAAMDKAEAAVPAIPLKSSSQKIISAH